MEAVLLGDVAPLDLAAHRRDVVLRKADGLQIGQAPPCLAEVGQQIHRPSIGGDAVVLAAHRLQHVAIAHPGLGLGRVVLQHRLVAGDRLGIFANAAERGGLQVAVGGVAGIGGEQQVGLGDRVRRPVLAVENLGVVVPGRGEARRQFQAPLQQALGVLVTAEARAGLGQHADGGHVGRVVFQEVAQQPLGHRQPVVAQGRGRLDQDRILHRSPDVAGVGGVRARVVAQDHQLVAERPPRASLRGVGPHGVGQRLDGLPVGAQAAERGAQQGQRGRMPRHDLEDLARLLGRQRRLAIEQAGGMRQRHVEPGDRC